MENMNCVELKELRKKLGMTQRELSIVLGVTIPTIVRWESGKNRPSHLALDSIKRLASQKENPATT